VSDELSDLFDTARYLCTAATALLAGLEACGCALRLVNQAAELLEERARLIAASANPRLRDLQ
jgi:hypothetical protein